MIVWVHWSSIQDDDPLWDATRCVYAYLGPEKESLYIGKADGRTVRERWTRSAKSEFWASCRAETSRASSRSWKAPTRRAARA